MSNLFRNFRVVLIGGICSAAVTACAPSSHMSANDAYVQDSYGYSQTGYGYTSEPATAPARRSRYGGELRGPCEVVVQNCGMMAVVPVYPVYQVVTMPEAPVVEAPPVVTYEPAPIYEPAPEPVYMPEPVYEPPVYEPPAQYWPEPDKPVTDWKPLRK